MKKRVFTLLVSFLSLGMLNAQLLLPAPDYYYKSSVGTTVGVTNIEIDYGAPAVNGREGKIWGTNVAHYDFRMVEEPMTIEAVPWQAGLGPTTTISFSTDVTINGKNLPAGTYGFFIAIYEDYCTLIFNTKSYKPWGYYAYEKEYDVLRVNTTQLKNQTPSKERLEYTMSNQTDSKVEIALEWERWKIPFTIEVDVKETTLAYIKSEMEGPSGFNPSSLVEAAEWCLNNNVNLEQALKWINYAAAPFHPGFQTYTTYSVKSKILNKLGRKEEAAKVFAEGLNNATAWEYHLYGRQLLTDKKIDEAVEVFKKNYKKEEGKWPTTVGMMRALSAKGKLKEALKYAKESLLIAPDELNKTNLKEYIKQLESGKALAQ